MYRPGMKPSFQLRRLDLWLGKKYAAASVFVVIVVVVVVSLSLQR